MQSHEIKSKNTVKPKKRVGRGGKRGTYSGRGQKGQNSRSNTRKRPEMRDIIKKLPKLRGYRFSSFKTKSTTVDVSKLENVFENGANITPRILLKSGLIERLGGKLPAVKLLGNGNITKKLLVSKCQISKKAQEKIEKAGGIIKK